MTFGEKVIPFLTMEEWFFNSLNGMKDSTKRSQWPIKFRSKLNALEHYMENPNGKQMDLFLAQKILKVGGKKKRKQKAGDEKGKTKSTEVWDLR